MVFFTWTLRSRGGLEVTMAATSPLQTVIKAKGYLVTSLSIKVKKRSKTRGRKLRIIPRTTVRC